MILFSIKFIMRNGETLTRHVMSEGWFSAVTMAAIEITEPPVAIVVQPLPDKVAA